MPGTSYRGPLPALTVDQQLLADELQRDVQMLAGTIGRRNVFYPAGLHAAGEFIQQQLALVGYEVQRQSFSANGVECANLEVQITGSQRPEDIIVVGAHYDSCDESPAANDNGSGVAATLALARHFANLQTPSRTLRFVFFVNEEPPLFKTELMGSLVYARRCKDRDENVIAMISLETIGYYSNLPGSQTYPIKPIGWLYPDTGNFIAFVGNYSSRSLVKNAIKTFRDHARFPSEGAAMPSWIEGVAWSDQWSFWQVGFPAIMITDTAPYRYPHYHSVRDTPDKLSYPDMARVVEGLNAVISDLGDAP